MKLLDQVRSVARVRHLSIHTEACYVRWIDHFIRFHRTAGGASATRTAWGLPRSNSSSLTSPCSVTSPPARRIRLWPPSFPLYRDVLKSDIGDLPCHIAPAARARLPVVLSAAKKSANCLPPSMRFPTEEPYALLARLMYGAGFCASMEACRLRVKDIDLTRHQITVRQGKGDKDRVGHAAGGNARGHRGIACTGGPPCTNAISPGPGWVWLPDALDRKFPGSSFLPKWQYLFASRQISKDPQGSNSKGRHHVHEGCVQRGARRRRAVPRLDETGPPATHFATVSPPTCSNPAATSAPSSSCSVTQT